MFIRDNSMYGEPFEHKLEISAALGCQGGRRGKQEGVAGHKVALCVASRHWRPIRLSWQCRSGQKPKSLILTTKCRSFSLSETQIEAFHRPSRTHW